MRFIFIICLFLSVSTVIAQSDQETRNIATLCKVWGFLKYYHPEVAKGKMDWDKEFMIRVKTASALSTKEETSKFYLEWIESLGEVKRCKKCNNEIPDSLRMNLNNDWIADTSMFSTYLTDKLLFIEKNRNQGKNKYVNKTNWIGSASINSEKVYADSIFPSTELKLLGLARYWNFTNYFFPYKYQMDIHWDRTLLDMIPLFLNSKDTVDYHMAILELIVRIDDTHGSFGTKFTKSYFGNKMVPFSAIFIENNLVVVKSFNDSICNVYDIRVGDVITHIEGIEPIDLYKKNSKYIFGSNENRKKGIYASVILDGSSDSLTLRFEREDDYLIKSIPRYHWSSKLIVWNSVEEENPYKELPGEIGYIDMGALDSKELEETMEMACSKKGIIIDLRNYPNVYATELAPYLNDSRLEFAKFTKPDFNYPGVFRYTAPMKVGKKGNNKYYKGKVVVLFNSYTQSAAEFTVMALQTIPNVICIGSQTSGADGNVTAVYFPGNLKTRFSGIGVYYPDGRETQRIGIVPDIEVKPTIQGIREGRDEVLEKAIEVINKQ